MLNAIRRQSSLMLVAAALFAYSGGAPSVAPPTGWSGEVETHGVLREIVHEGKMGATVLLHTLLPDSNLYAVGALAELAGEVTIAGGKVYLSYPDGADRTRDETVVDSTTAATLLVAARVPAWRDVVTERPISMANLDRDVAALAAAAGINTDRRLPFVIEGQLEDLEWHVVDGRRLASGGGSHQDHRAASVRLKRDRAAAILIGFYSNHDQGVFTHMGAATHMHCVVGDPVESGHVDQVTIPAGATVRFPMLGTPAARTSLPGGSLGR